MSGKVTEKVSGKVSGKVTEKVGGKVTGKVTEKVTGYYSELFPVRYLFRLLELDRSPLVQ